MVATIRLALITVLLVLLGAQSALAGDVFCVGKPSCPGGLTKATLADAITATDSDPDLDRIEIGPVTLNERDLAASQPVDIVGSGPSTVIAGGSTAGANAWVLNLNNVDSSISSLTVRENQGFSISTGVLRLGGSDADGVNVEGTGFARTGVFVQGGTFSNGSVTVSPSPDFGALAISSTGTLDRVTASGYRALATSGTGTARRVTLTGTAVGLQSSGTLLVENALIRTTGASATELGMGANSSGLGGTSSVTARYVTIVGSGAAGSRGVEAAAYGDGSGSGTSSIDLRHVIVRGYANSLSRNPSGPGVSSASISADWSNFDLSTKRENGAGVFNFGSGNVTDTDPQFRNPAGGDFHLAGTSPLIDHGDPTAPPPAEATNDLDGRPRVIDGNADGTARRDMGAYEYQGRPTISAVIASPNPATTGEAITFSATATAGGESAIADYRWDLDGDGSFETDSGANPSTTRGYPLPGTIPIKVRAIAADGGFAEGTTSLVVTGVLSVSAFSLTNRTFAVAARPTAVSAKKRAKKGTRFAYTLSMPASVTITIGRVTRGYHKGKRCVAKKSKHAKRCTRITLAGRLTRSGIAGRNTLSFTGRIGKKPLKPGRYTASLVATSAIGAKAYTKAVKFRVVRR
jgi:hypothetical protein